MSEQTRAGPLLRTIKRCASDGCTDPAFIGKAGLWYCPTHADWLTPAQRDEYVRVAKVISGQHT